MAVVHRFIDKHGEGGGGVKGYPSSKMFAKLVNKNAINNKKLYPPQKIFTTPVYPPSHNLAKTSRTLPLDFQTCFKTSFIKDEMIVLIQQEQAKNLGYLSLFSSPGNSIHIESYILEIEEANINIV